MGYTYALLYSLFTAISFTFIDKLDDLINPYYSLFVMSILATLFFNIINYKNLRTMYQHCYRNKMLYLAMSISIGLNWMCSIFAPNLSDPFIYLSLLFISLAGCGLIFIKKDSFISSFFNYFSVLIFIILIYIIYRYYHIGAHRSSILGVAFGVASGITGYLYALYSNKLTKINNANLFPTQILAIRMWPLILVLFITLIHNHVSFYLDTKNILIEVIMSIFTLIIPMYFSQFAIKSLGANKFSIFVALTPAFTFVIYSISMMSINKNNMFLAVAITFVLVLSKIKFPRK